MTQSRCAVKFLSKGKTTGPPQYQHPAWGFLKLGQSVQSTVRRFMSGTVSGNGQLFTSQETHPTMASH
ncbi:hypothetical protein OS493_020802 [Desmophyllum pertusum]|uniref:Uncharacterized protein n=1 Tax=Desmophyllum pertusum TaxID=174260 RepID=A0A9W9YEE8_9CNID|nr:hypothetical protein OS493_020802 [Desmophyllum pertusum]